MIRNPDDERTNRKVKRIIEEIHHIRVKIVHGDFIGNQGLFVEIIE